MQIHYMRFPMKTSILAIGLALLCFLAFGDDLISHGNFLGQGSRSFDAYVPPPSTSKDEVYTIFHQVQISNVYSNGCSVSVLDHDGESLGMVFIRGLNANTGSKMAVIGIE